MWILLQGTGNDNQTGRDIGKLRGAMNVVWGGYEETQKAKTIKDSNVSQGKDVACKQAEKVFNFSQSKLTG
ncbi:hypothetical protein Tco_1032084 [Tanacetum coccineum]|uniref:Uncharacterized protein n=1 Tax=Tanacetum coccineum TaxID=301880 RepID=A0ABQ5GBX8_9ASTR